MIENDFSKELRSGNINDGIVFYNSKMDERTDLLETTISQILGSYIQIATGIDANENLLTKIQETMQAIPSATEVSVTIQTEDNLSYNQTNQLARIGYLIAVLTISLRHVRSSWSNNPKKARKYFRR